jgi:hypothetical protein
MECKDKATGKPVVVICAVWIDEDIKEKMYHFTPLAKMFEGNPYEELIPPDAGLREEDIASEK